MRLELIGTVGIASGLEGHGRTHVEHVEGRHVVSRRDTDHQVALLLHVQHRVKRVIPDDQ